MSIVERYRDGRLNKGLAYLDQQNSALCAECAAASESDELEQFRPVESFVPNYDEYCDQCSSPLGEK